MSRKRKPAPDPVREGVVRVVHAVVEQGGAVLFGRNGQPFAFYPPRRDFLLDWVFAGYRRHRVPLRLDYIEYRCLLVEEKDYKGFKVEPDWAVWQALVSALWRSHALLPPDHPAPDLIEDPALP